MFLKNTTFVVFCLLIFFLITINAVDDKNYCYTKDDNPYVYFSSRTAYENVYGRNMSALPGCDVVYIWSLIRHGTRYGSPKFHKMARNVSAIRDQIIENHEVHKRGKLCDNDLENLKNWTHKGANVKPYTLTSQGRADMKGIARRLKNVFHSYFDNWNNSLLIQSTKWSRCQISAIVFTNELFETSYADLVGDHISVNDPLLHLEFDYADNSKTGQYEKFTTSLNVEKMLDEVTKRLGYENKLSFDFVRHLYEHCAYENAWSLHSRPGFCAAFTKENLKLLEYANDLFEFYVMGPRNKTIRKLACPIVRDLFARLTIASDNTNATETGVFYFAHGETLIPTMLQLGLFHDRQPLKYDNYESQSNRLWKGSQINPFASNLIVVLYECSKKFKIVFYNNEKMVKFPGCMNGICSMERFRDLFSQKILKDCPLNGCSSSIAQSWILLMAANVYICYKLRYFVKLI